MPPLATAAESVEEDGVKGDEADGDDLAPSEVFALSEGLAVEAGPRKVVSEERPGWCHCALAFVSQC